ncbi:coiled-coil domain-containing protein 30 [Phasianus colchicus]|uniref:coiled-coil domain-containing protein 30 n=1 Tax=Phasianus colchicus TaxID=9054 RepID=UPI00129DEC6C|nr:coiled-coil domain-containing protein 30 [Phasianus colchicus]
MATGSHERGADWPTSGSPAPKGRVAFPQPIGAALGAARCHGAPPPRGPGPRRMEAAAAAPAEPPVPAEDVRRWLRAEGADPGDPAEEQLGLAWRLLRRAEARLGEAERRRAEELREVERYVGHVRGLSQERDAAVAECERDNERLGMELARLRLQHEAQLKEVQEMLEQEGLSEIAHSNASEQIAYLLVERTALLEKLQVADQKLNSHSCVDRLCAAQLQDEFAHIHQELEDELQQQRESMQHAEDTVNEPYRRELEREQASRVRVEQDLAEATQRLLMAHKEIQRLTDELAAQGKEQSRVGAAQWSVLQDSGSQGEGMDEWRQDDRTELQKAMEHNSRLDKEILALRARVQTLDLERKTFLELVEQLKEEISEYQKGEKRGFLLPTPGKTEEIAACSLQGTKDEGKVEEDCITGKAGSDQEDRCQGSETLHKRCREVIENIEGRNSQLLHKLHKLEQEHEDLVERNEELESILGETQIQTKQDKEQFESEVEGLHRKITSLEMELLEVQKNKTEMSGEEQASNGAQEMQEMLQSCQETIEKLGSQLGERREWRKQLASELELLREDLKAEKKDLPNTKPELKSQSVQRTSASRDFINASHERLQKDNALLETEVSELVRENEQVNKLQQQREDVSMDGKAYEEQMAKVVFLEEQIRNLTDEQEQLCSELLESNKKREELEKQLKESNEEKQSLMEKIAQLKQDILTTREQHENTFEEALRMNQGMVHRDNRLLMSQSSAGSLDGSIKQSISEERFQQQEERLQQLRHDLRRVQNLCSSAERELRYEREKNIDLQKQNLLLQQECTKVKAELKQARTKLLDTTETCSSLSAEWEKSQQKVKELEQELLKCSKAEKLQSGLQEKLVQEKSKVYEAQKQLSKIQQKLKDSQHQLLLAEARVSDKKLLEEELKEARENEARVQQELREELLKRKLLEQQVEELRQQLRHSHETEVSLAKMHVELQAKTLHALEDDKKTDSGEHLQCQKESQKLSEQLSLLKEENKALYEEGVRLLNQKDLYVRKYNEMQLRHKDKIRRAKATFIHEVKQRDSRIKQLENELSESKLQVEKGKALIAQITTENEKLLQERRRLLQRITDQEETPWSNRAMVAALQSRMKILDEENMRLHESKLHLSGHVQPSQRALRSIHTPNTEDLKSANFSERQLQSKVLASSPRASFPPREPPDSLSSLKPVHDAKPEGGAESQDSSFCLSPSQPSEIGYLNVASPGDTTASQLQEESQSISSENF